MFKVMWSANKGSWGCSTKSTQEEVDSFKQQVESEGGKILEVKRFPEDFAAILPLLAQKRRALALEAV